MQDILTEEIISIFREAPGAKYIALTTYEEQEKLVNSSFKIEFYHSKCIYSLKMNEF